MTLQLFAIWIVMLATAIVNAVIRDTVLTPKWGEAEAHVISSITLSVAILVIVYVAFSLVVVREDHDLFLSWPTNFVRTLFVPGF